MLETAAQDRIHTSDAARLRLVTAASLFDGHDAALHIMRRLIQTHGTEVIHLGHHRGALEVVRAALQEDADAIVVSSHRRGRAAYFTYMIDLLRARGAGHIQVYVSSGDACPPDEIAELEAAGVAHVYHTQANAPAAVTRMAADLIARIHQTRDGASQPPLPPPAEPAPIASTAPAGLEPARETAPGAAVIVEDDTRQNAPAWWPVPPPPNPAPTPPPALPISEIRWEYGTLGHAPPPLTLTPSSPPDVQTTQAADPAALTPVPAPTPPTPIADPEFVIGQMLTRLEQAHPGGPGFHDLRKPQPWTAGTPPVIGMTGTGGAGKSSVTDELLLRFLAAFPEMRIAVLSVDPTRRRSGGALLGDRIRMNALSSPRVYMRSMATRRQHMATSAVLHECIQYLKGQDFDLIIVETAGIGQSDSNIVDLVDLPVYVMTSDYGAASQLEKIDMLDFAELIILNKYDQRGAADALRDIRQQWRRNRQAYELHDGQIPVYPTIASHCHDPGMNWMFANLCRLLRERVREHPDIQPTGHTRLRCDFNPPLEISEQLPNPALLIPAQRMGYLAEIAEQGRALHARIEAEAAALTRAQQCWQALAELNDPERPAALAAYSPGALNEAGIETSLAILRRRYQDSLNTVSADLLQRLREWQHQHRTIIRESLPASADVKGLDLPNIATSYHRDWGDLLRYLARENLPGEYPYTSGIQTHTSPAALPLTIVADDGTPERGNRQFHLLSSGHSELHLVTRFDSLTLYGEDPDERLEIDGATGDGGVNIATLDAMKKLYSGFDLCAPGISLSMTVNGPAPILLAMLINTAIDQQVEHYLKQDPARWQQALQTMDALFRWRPRPDYDAELPPEHNTLGLGLLGVSGDELVDADTYANIRAQTLSRLRGRVRVDILEQEQAQKTCIFSPEFSLRMLGDVQQYCAEHGARYLHTASVSALHFAEVGASPVTQLAFALANGFTLLEYYLARGINLDEIAPDLCFFLAIGDDLEYSVLGRAARRIWARAMRERYGADSTSQQFQCRMQARDGHDHADALHAIVRRQLGLNLCENPWQGGVVISALTDLVEQAVYREFESLSTRGGVLAAMGSLYQRDKIHDEWMQRALKAAPDDLASARTQAGEDAAGAPRTTLTSAEKTRLVASVQLWHGLRNARSQTSAAASDTQEHGAQHGLSGLQYTARGHGNLFAALLDAVKTHSLGQITRALYAAGGEYRRTV